MAAVYKILGQANPSNTSADLYTAPSGYGAVVSTITVCNTSATPTTYTIIVRPSADASDAIKHRVASTISIDGNTSISYTLGLTLNAGDKIRVSTPSTGSVAFGAFGTEISLA